MISPKGINYKELKELNMTLDDLIELMRGCDVFRIDEIAYAIIETNGNLCVIRKAELEPVTREDLKVKVNQNTLPINIIMDGKVMPHNMALAEIDQKFINDCLEKAKVKNIKNHSLKK